MGIIRAAAGAIGGSLADSWLEYITAGDMGPTTVLTKGVQVTRTSFIYPLFHRIAAVSML